VKIKSQTWN